MPARAVSSSETVGSTSTGMAEIDCIHPSPLELPQQARESRLEAPQVDVVTEPRLAGDPLHARLVGIELPRVEIENRRQSAVVDEAPEQGPRKRERQQPEPAAARSGHVAAKQARRARRYFQDTGTFKVKGRGRGVWDTIMIVCDGKEAGTVFVSRLRHDAMRPWRALVYRPARGPVAAHGLPAHVLEEAFRPFDVPAEGFRRLVAHALVIHPVARYFVSGIRHAPDVLRVVFGHPSQCEERALHAGGVEQLEHTLDVTRYTAHALAPGVLRDQRLEGRDLEP